MPLVDIDRVQKWLTARLIIANFNAALLINLYLRLITAKPLHTSETAFNLSWAVTFGVTTLLSFGFGAWLLRRRFVAEWNRVNTGEPLTDADRDALISQPWRLAQFVFGLWMLAAVGVLIVFGVQNSRNGLTDFVVTFLGALTASAITYLLTEDIMRVHVGAALGGRIPPQSRALGVGPRLRLAWLLGSGIPLVGVAFTPALIQKGAEFPASVPVGVLAFVGLAAGIGTMNAASNSVVRPLEAVRQAMEKVRAGDLETRVPVDDAGEVGRIEAGFNTMVRDLGERARLERIFGRYVGTDVARTALERGSALGGSVAEASMLFVDVTGSSTLAGVVEPQTLVEMLNDLFGVVVTEVSEENGLVNKFEGDAALCIFGAPIRLEDHQSYALRAARRINRRVTELQLKWPALDVGIGVSSGPVVAGNVGAKERYEFTVIGQPVNEAARLSDAAKEHRTRLLARYSTVEASGDEAENWCSAGEVELRGIGPVPVSQPRPESASASDDQTDAHVEDVEVQQVPVSSPPAT